MLRKKPVKPRVKKEVQKPEATEVKEPVKETVQAEGLSDKARQLLLLLKKQKKPVTDLSKEMNISSQAVRDLAEELSNKGYDIRVGHNGKDQKRVSRGEDQVLNLVRGGEDIVQDALPISVVNKTYKIGLISEIRMGAKQSQISLAHWIYKEVFEREGIDFAVVAGGLVVGKTTPTLAPDVIKSDPNELVEYVVKHFPQSKKFKTYVVSGRSELSWKDKDGFDIVSAICEQREDLFKAGDLERTFDVKGVRVKVMSPFDDNAPQGVSYGPQKIADNLRDDPMPQILVIGGTHRRSRIPVYNGMYVETVPSLHTQMRRQARKGVAPRIGYTILELKFNPDWSFNPTTGLRVSLNSLDAYVNPQDCFGVDLSKADKLDDVAKKVLEWFVREQILSEGELSRRLGQSKESVRKVVEALKGCGYNIPFKADTKRYEFEMQEKEKFSPSSMKYEEVYQFKTKEAEVSDTHLGNKKDLPEVFQKAYKDAAELGVRRVYNPGDVTDGPGSTGYRGHQNDVKFVGLDDLEDYVVAKWPKVKIKVDPRRPILVTRLVYNEEGKFTYKEELVKEGEIWLQTDAIDGNHDEWTYKQSGHSIVRALAARLPEHIRYLGFLHGATAVDGIYHKVIHPRGGGGYALSFRLEKHMAALRKRGETDLPTVVYLGHWHTAYLLFDQRLGMVVPCIKDEDEFHVILALIPLIGMFVSEVYTNQKGDMMTRVVSEYKDYYSKKK